MLKTPWQIVGAFVFSACATGEGADSVAETSSFPFLPESGGPASFADAFSVVDTLILEENPAADVVTASPRVRFDGRDLLVADVIGYQVRVYAPDGRLKDVLGRQGDGPGEFRNPISARRVGDGRLLVADIGAMRLTLFSDDPEKDPEILVLPVLPYDAIALDEQRYLITGLSPSIHPSNARPMLHIWNAASATLERSFFPPPRPDYLDETAADGEWAHVVMRGDTVWSVSTFTDSIFLFGTDGLQVGSVPLPLVEQARPESASDMTTVLWTADTVHLLTSGAIVVQLARKAGFRTRRRVNYIVIVDDDGTPRTTVVNTPRLRAVANDLFYFQNPHRMEPNNWIVARWKAS